MPVRRFLIRLVALASAVSATAGAQDVAFARVWMGELQIPITGVAVIRDAAHWSSLCKRFGGFRTTLDGTIRRPIPPAAVDFQESTLIVVALGPSSRYGNVAQWIRRVRKTPDSIVVDVSKSVGPIDIEASWRPLEVVRIPFTRKPVAFHALDSLTTVPPPADWWRPVDWRWWDSSDVGHRDVFLRAWLNDPTTGLKDLEEIAWRGGARYDVASSLLALPAIRRSPGALAGLAQNDGSPGTDARRLLIVQFGGWLATETRMSPATWQRVLSAFGSLSVDTLRPEAARALVTNPTVLNTRDLLRSTTYDLARYPNVLGEACRLYLNRWSPVDTSRGPYGLSYASVAEACTKPPPVACALAAAPTGFSTRIGPTNTPDGYASGRAPLRASDGTQVDLSLAWDFFLNRNMRGSALATITRRAALALGMYPRSSVRIIVDDTSFLAQQIETTQVDTANGKVVERATYWLEPGAVHRMATARRVAFRQTGTRGTIQNEVTVPGRAVLEAFDEFMTRYARTCVTPAAPTREPIELWHRFNTRASPEAPAERVFSNLIDVRFVSGTSRAERTEAIAATGGDVVGGFNRDGATEGFYVVQFPPGTTDGQMLQAIKGLRARPSVSAARFDRAPPLPR